jgi:excisionase family DNA binding protein
VKASNLRPALTLLQLDYPSLSADQLKRFLDEKPATPPPVADDRLLLKPSEVARRLSCSTRTVWYLLQQGKLKRDKRLGRKATRISYADLQSFLAR